MINVYQILFEDKPIYVGQTIRSLNDRFSTHKSKAKLGSNSCPKLYNKLRKYSISKFKIKLIEQVEQDNIDERETYWIKFYDTINNGCNICSGGRTNRGWKKTTKQIEEQKIRTIKNYKNSALAKWNGSKEQKLFLKKLYTGRPCTWKEKVSLTKSSGLYNINIDGINYSYHSIKGFAKKYNLNSRSLFLSLKNNKLVHTKGHYVRVEKLT